MFSCLLNSANNWKTALPTAHHRTSTGIEIHRSHAPVQGLGLCCTAMLSSHDTAIARLLMD